MIEDARIVLIIYFAVSSLTSTIVHISIRYMLLMYIHPTYRTHTVYSISKLKQSRYSRLPLYLSLFPIKFCTIRLIILRE